MCYINFAVYICLDTIERIKLFLYRQSAVLIRINKYIIFNNLPFLEN